MKRYVKSDQQFKGYLDEFNTIPVYVDDQRSPEEAAEERMQLSVDALRRVINQCISASEKALQQLDKIEGSIPEIISAPADSDDDEYFAPDLNAFYKTAYNIDRDADPYLRALNKIYNFSL